MRYFEMSLQDSKAIFDHADNFPLRVTVGDETRLLEKTEVEKLRAERVNFDIDEAEAALILIKYGTC
jgi:hypothetical protein